MKKSIELIYDDIGDFYYEIDGVNLSPYMYFLYKMIERNKIKKETKKIYSEDTNNIDKRIDYYKKELDDWLKTDAESCVGPFFYINDTLFLKAKELKQFNANLDYFDNEIGHFNWFYNELIHNKDLNLDKFSDYDRYIRGRILYDNKNGIYKVYSHPKILLDHNIRHEILKAFNINENKIIQFLVDEHYLIEGAENHYE